MKIIITTKKEGFRRAGMAHHGTREYPVDKFSDKQVEALMDEPMLIVEFAAEDGAELDMIGEEELAELREKGFVDPDSAQADVDAAAPAAPPASAGEAEEWGSPDSPPVEAPAVPAPVEERDTALEAPEKKPADKAAAKPRNGKREK